MRRDGRNSLPPRIGTNNIPPAGKPTGNLTACHAVAYAHQAARFSRDFEARRAVPTPRRAASDTGVTAAPEWRESFHSQRYAICVPAPPNPLAANAPATNDSRKVLSGKVKWLPLTFVPA